MMAVDDANVVVPGEEGEYRMRCSNGLWLVGCQEPKEVLRKVKKSLSLSKT